MGKVRIVAADSVAWQPVHEAVDSAVAAQMSPAERAADVRILHAGVNDTLQLVEARIAAHETIALHAHAEDEIIYILEGELIIGRKHLGPGASVFVAGHTLYGFRSGAAGVRLLNFRGRGNTSFISKAAFLAARADQSADGGRR